MPGPARCLNTTGERSDAAPRGWAASKPGKKPARRYPLTERNLAGRGASYTPPGLTPGRTRICPRLMTQFYRWPVCCKPGTAELKERQEKPPALGRALGEGLHLIPTAFVDPDQCGIGAGEEAAPRCGACVEVPLTTTEARADQVRYIQIGFIEMPEIRPKPRVARLGRSRTVPP